MIEIREWLGAHAGKVLVGCTAFLLALSLVALGSSLFGGDQESAKSQADQLISKLKNDLADAESTLESDHAALLSSLPGVDFERVRRDATPGRTVLLSLVDSSASSRDVAHTQQVLDARYDFLDSDSRTLTEFIPEWMSATGSGSGVGTVFTLGELTIDVTAVSGLDYTYVGLARLDPVSPDGTSTAKSEFVVFRFSTSQDGAVTSFEAYRASTRTRDAMLADQAASTATPTPKPTSSTASDGPDDGD